MDSNVVFTLQKLAPAEFQKISRFIENEVGIKMPPAKKAMLESRLQKRLKKLGMSSFKEYVKYAFSPDGELVEIPELIDAVTTNKTDFMREPAHFDYMEKIALPELSERRDSLDLWSVASSTGPEPYTMAMIMEEYNRGGRSLGYRILGTDICRSALETGRTGIYPEADIAPLPPSFKKQYLLRSKNRNQARVRIKPALRSRVTFQYLNLMTPQYDISGGFESFDIIFCRNVLIYFNRDNQKTMLNKIYDRMKVGAYLFIGHSESLAGSHLPLQGVAPTIYKKVN